MKGPPRDKTKNGQHHSNGNGSTLKPNGTYNPPPSLPFPDALKGFLAFSVSYAVISTLTFGPLVLLCLFPRSKIVLSLLATAVLPYYIYALTPSLGRYYELHDGYPRPAWSQQFFVFRWMRTFLRFHMVVAPELHQAETKANAQFVVAEFPHAVWADYHVPMDALLHTTFPNIAPNIRSLAASVLFRAPIVREWCLWTSGLDARKAVAEAALERGRTILVRPGGLAEQLRTSMGREIVYLQRRKGFLVLAMKHGVPVVPCYIFGASDYHYTCGRFFGLREWIQKNFGMCLPLAIGYWGSMCPRPVPTTVVFGKPLSFPVKEAGHPSPQEIDRAHQQFCTALLDLFEEHKHAAGYGDRKLEIV
jgi:1-acyl-sn-glycerol-3-phosphate acyltransferase